jgi:hypothetical protein
MHIHNVYFWLNDCSDERKTAFEEGMTDLLKIDLIEKAYWGQPAGVDREVVDSSYDYSLTVIFKNRENHDAYQTHPDHDVFIENHKDLWKTVKVLDTKTQ